MIRESSRFLSGFLRGIQENSRRHYLTHHSGILVSVWIVQDEIRLPLQQTATDGNLRSQFNQQKSICWYYVSSIESSVFIPTT